MRSKHLLLGLLFTSLLILPSLTAANTNTLPDNTPNQAQTGLKIIATTAIPADIVKNILGDKGTVEAILTTPDEETIHHFDGPTEVQKIAIKECSLFVAFGIVQVEPWVQSTLDSLGDQAPPVLNISTAAMQKPDPLIANQSNPHVWMDPNNIKMMASIITQKLIDIDSANGAYYTSQNSTYQAKLDGLLSRIEGNKTLYQGTKVVVNHPAYTGFLDLLGVIQHAAIDLHGEHEEESGTAHIHEIKDEMVENNITLIITRPMGNNKEVNELARAVDAKIIYIASLIYMKDENGNDLTDYIQMMDFNLRSLGLPVNTPEEIDGFPLLLPIFALASPF